MKTCARCFYTETHPLNLTFDQDGVCSGCRVHEEKDQIDWRQKWDELVQLTGQYKNTLGNNYDCIIPVSGARDSFFIVDVVKNKLGMNPLLVTYNKQYNTDLGIRNLAKLRMVFDCDIFTLSVNPAKLKKITRATVRRLGSMYWHCIAGQTVFPVQIAVKLKIPLIIWGAHQGVDQVGMYSHHNQVEMTRKYRKEHDLMGLEAEDLINPKDELTEKDLFQFFYPDNADIENVGVRGIYLNNFIRWDTKAQHEEMIKKFDYETHKQTRTFDTYNDVDCFNYSDVHDYIKYIKHGYSKVHDHVAREIRLKRLTREDGLALINKYQLIEPENLDQFIKWMGITENGFHFLMDQHRNKEVWMRDEFFKWKKRFDLQNSQPDSNLVDKARLVKSSEVNFKFIETSNKRPEYHDNKYIIIGKGYPSFT